MEYQQWRQCGTATNASLSLLGLDVHRLLLKAWLVQIAACLYFQTPTQSLLPVLPCAEIRAKNNIRSIFLWSLLERNSTRQRWADEQSLFHLLLSCIQSAVFEGNESSTWGCPGLLVLRVMWANFSYCVLDINLGSTSLWHSGAVVSKHINVRLTGARQSA